MRVSDARELVKCLHGGKTLDPLGEDHNHK